MVQTDSLEEDDPNFYPEKKTKSRRPPSQYPAERSAIQDADEPEQIPPFASRD